MTGSDPVCGMQVDLGKAAVQEEHGGWLYVFCSGGCQRLFTLSPDLVAQKHKTAPPAEMATCCGAGTDQV